MPDTTTMEPAATAAGSSDPVMLVLVRGLHTAVYLVMVVAIGILLDAGIPGTPDRGYGSLWRSSPVRP